MEIVIKNDGDDGNFIYQISYNKIKLNNINFGQEFLTHIHTQQQKIQEADNIEI